MKVRVTSLVNHEVDIGVGETLKPFAQVTLEDPSAEVAAALIAASELRHVQYVKAMYDDELPA